MAGPSVGEQSLGEVEVARATTPSGVRIAGVAVRVASFLR